MAILISPINKSTRKRGTSPKTAGYSHKVMDAQKAVRRRQCEARNAEWRELSIKGQLNELAARPGNCARQKVRLQDRVERAMKNKSQPKVKAAKAA